MSVDIIKQIILNILTALYKPFWFALIMAILLMQVYLTLCQSSLKTVILDWWNHFRNEAKFRRLFLLFFYITLVLFRTLLDRDIWMDPLENVFGPWKIYSEEGQLDTECVENLIMLLPYMVLLWVNFHEKLCKKQFGCGICLWQSLKITFLTSLMIEVLQLILRLGTFQLSDLFYNTLGGLIGGLVYWVGYRITCRVYDNGNRKNMGR